VIDIGSIVIGLFVGFGIGFIAGAMRSRAVIEDLKYQYELLYRDYSRVATRDVRGRFTKPKDGQ
jgi:uncharacterized membrane-anchored protein YhcB (DUF1043 family)